MAATKYIVWVTGATSYTDYSRVERALALYPPSTVVIHGEAPGADTLADRAAHGLGMLRVRVPYHGAAGRAGGPVRNKLICDLAAAYAAAHARRAVCLAFGGDRGTDDSVKLARKAGMDVREFDR